MNAKDNSEYEEDKDSEEERWKMTFDRHHDFIVDRMSPDFGLIDKLYSKSTITDKEKEHVKAEKTVYERNETLIKYMGSRSQLGKLIEALRESDQKHLVKYLENDGNFGDEFDGDWPLTEKEILTIKINYESLIDLIDVSDLLDRLYSTGVINKRQREFISSKSTSYEKNEALLEIVRRGSLRSYWQTIKCLHQSNQSHIAEILETGGVAVRVDANLEIEDMDIGRLEEEITLQINSLLSNQSIRVLDLKLIAAKKGHSVSLYFLCNQSNEVDYLEKMATDGRLKEFVQILFNELIKTQKTIKITLKWTPDVFVRCREAIQVSIPLEFVDFRTALNFKRKALSENKSSYSDICRVIDVTKLKTKIYVLCLIRSWGLTEDASLSTMICRFEDRDPYSIVEEILLRRSDISEFRYRYRNIVSSVKESCLYVLTSSKKENYYFNEVIRVEIKENEENSMQDPSKWLELEEGFHPSVLSISRDGDLMMVNRYSPIILRIYDPDARLRLSVTLHENILVAYKSVEQSNGNFIILHLMETPTEDADDDGRAKETYEEDVFDEQAIEEESSSDSSFSDDSISDRTNERVLLWTVSEVSRDGETIIRSFIPQNLRQQLSSLYGGDLCIGSRDRVFVADTNNDRIIVLDSYLRWVGILNPQIKDGDKNAKLQRPCKLFYDEDLHEMIITEREKFFICDLIWK